MTLRAVSPTELAAKDGRDGVYWTAFKGKVYDFTSFVEKHPGGRIIILAAGKHGVSLIESYHSPKAHAGAIRVLENMPVVGSFPEPKVAKDKDDTFWKVLRQRVVKRLDEKGLPYRGTQWFATVEVFLLFFFYALLMYLRNSTGNLFWAAVAGVVVVRCGFVMHSGNHGSFAPSVLLNNVAAFAMDLMGASAYVWWFDHGVAHHLTPNEYNLDNDCQIAEPYFRFHPSIKRKWWHKNQQYMVLSSMCFGLLKWYTEDIACMLSNASGSAAFPVRAFDLGWTLFWKSLWFLLFMVYPTYTYGFGRAFAMLLITYGVAGQLMANIFIVNHIQPGLTHDEDEHWARKQVLSSCNWSSKSLIANFLSAGLNHQIEHHLFPSMNIYNYPYISDVVRDTCKEFGLPYHNFSSFWTAHASLRGFLQALGDHDEVPEKILLENALKK